MGKSGYLTLWQYTLMVVLKPCIHRLFPYDMFPFPVFACDLVMCHTDNDRLLLSGLFHWLDPGTVWQMWRTDWEHREWTCLLSVWHITRSKAKTEQGNMPQRNSLWIYSLIPLRCIVTAATTQKSQSITISWLGAYSSKANCQAR